MVPFLNTYFPPLPGGHILLGNLDTSDSESVMHACDTSGNFHFDIVSNETNEVLRKATPEEVRARGVNPALYLNAFMEEEQPPVDEPPVDEPPVDEPPVDEPPVDEPPVDEGENNPAPE